MEYPELDVNEPVMGLTALHVAAEKGYSSCVTVLLAAGKMGTKSTVGLQQTLVFINFDYVKIPVIMIFLLAHCNLVQTV